MALLPTIMSLFGSKNNTPGPGQVSNPSPGEQAAGTNPTVPSQTTPQSNGSNPAIPAIPPGEGSPLDKFQDLWKADTTDTTKTTTQPSLVPNFNLDPKGLMEAASKVNFTAHIDPELVTKALGGDSQSFLEVLNQASRYGFAAATASSGELIKNSLNSAQTVLHDNVLPGAFREHQISHALTQSNPIFSDPSVAPMLGMLKDQLTSKFPTASPEQIAATAAEYLGQMSSKIVTASGGSILSREQATRGPGGYGRQKEQDWSIFFDTPTSG
jgi:hypothetical protein